MESGGNEHGDERGDDRNSKRGKAVWRWRVVVRSVSISVATRRVMEVCDGGWC